MSSFKKAAPRRTHRERSQLGARSKLGLLEKKQDYKLRAIDFHRKEDSLTQLKKLALDRNPDEFYFKMISSKTNKGVHVAERNEHFDADTVKLLKDKDLNYLNYQRQVNLKKLEKSLVLPEFEGKHTTFDDSKITKKQKSSPSQPTDTIDHTYKDQPSASIPQKTTEEGDEQQSKPKPLNQETLNQIKLERYKHLKMTKSRLERLEKLDQACRELSIRKCLVQKGKKRKVGTDAKGLSVFKWKGFRSK